ncbi:unnamed protein product [Eretmochelys imbricata]
MLHTLHFLTLMSRPHTKWRDYLPPKEGEEPRWASLYSTLVPRPAGDISWRLLHGAVSTGMHLAQFTPTPEAFCSVRENSGACLSRMRQVAAPIPAPPEPLVEVLAALFPTLVPFRTPYPWPHEVARPPPQPPPGSGQSLHLQYQEEDVGQGGALRLWGLFLFLPSFTHLGRVPLGSVRWLPRQL